MNAGHAVELYAYYKVPQALGDRARAELSAMQALARQACPGVQSRWLCRAEIRDGMLTWMEVHTHPDGLTTDAAARICATLAGWPSVHVGSRHVEVFTALPVSLA